MRVLQSGTRTSIRLQKYSIAAATANRLRVSICGRPCKNFPHYSLITTQNLMVVSHAACAHVGGPFFGDADRGPAPLRESSGDACMADPHKRRLAMF